MKLKKTAMLISAMFATVVTPQQEQLLQIDHSINNIQSLTYNQSDIELVMSEFANLKKIVGFFNSFITVELSEITDPQTEINELKNIKKQLESTNSLIKTYLYKKGNFDMYKQLLRSFSNEIFKLDLTIVKIREEHNLFNIIECSNTFSEKGLNKFIERIHQNNKVA